MSWMAGDGGVGSKQISPLEDMEVQQPISVFVIFLRNKIIYNKLITFTQIEIWIISKSGKVIKKSCI